MNNRAVATRPETAAAAHWTAQQVATIKAVICPGITDAELALFAHVCRHLGLDPFLNQIHAIKRNAWNAQTRQNEGKLTIQTSIHGLRLIADRTRCYAPGRKAEFEYGADGKLVAATAFVMKFAQGTWHEVSDTAYWDEYVQTNRDGRPIALWETKPRIMLAKVAEALAIRRAFPAETSGAYIDDEMPPPAAPVAAPVAALPAPAVDHATGEIIEGESTPAPAAPQPAAAVPLSVAHTAAVQRLVASGWEVEQVEQAAVDLFGQPFGALKPPQVGQLVRAGCNDLLRIGPDGKYAEVAAAQ